jgi:ketosteroid isomerase-like protein
MSPATDSTDSTNTGSAVGTVERFFAAVEAGDVAELERIYSPDARIWHNDDGAEQGVPDNLRVLRGLHRVVGDLRYEIVRRAEVDGGVFQQHVLHGRLPDGSAVAMPAAMYLQIADGRVRRIEEYLDSAHAAPIRAARTAPTGAAATVAPGS